MFEAIEGFLKGCVIFLVCFCLISIMNHFIVFVHEYELVNNLDCSISMKKNFQVICKEKVNE